MSEIVLLDTNFISFLMKGDSRSTAYKPHLQDRMSAISFMTVAELLQWAAIDKKIIGLALETAFMEPKPVSF